MNLNAIRLATEARMKGRRSHPWKEMDNKYDHGLRVAKLAVTLRGRVLPGDASRDGILTAAAWLHDVENGEERHAIKGARTARALLDGLCAPEELDEICAMIELHDDRGERRRGYPALTRVLQDADLLDHFGAYDVWMNCVYAPPHGLTLGEQLEYMLNVRPEEYEVNRGELNFALSRRIFDEKADFFRRFTERLRVEASGEAWSLGDPTDEATGEEL